MDDRARPSPLRVRLPADRAVILLVLGAMRHGPRWSVSLRAVRATLAMLVREGLVERVKPPGGTARNMVALTPAGRDYLAAVDAATQEQK